ALFTVMVLTGLLSAVHRRQAVHQVFSLCLGMTAIAVPLAVARRARLTATRETPAHATAGEPMRYTIRVTNRGSRRLRGALLVETPPDPRPSMLEFALEREPEEEKRNRFDRLFAYHRWRWLLARRRLFDDGAADRWLDLDPGKTAELRI